ncbi:MmcQ/YjbR family DNA-binding protein [Paenibacillus daejeonensis]|uniref:MmcQ/YjbR family DNA-binding protein n=1 Tax=Paenibacillus daejeonensis TaxID=135193 RepID=UPI00036136E3|nr:MmcQ/YjbR family DNA-binding protein [Paenibacillus daejeonensis]
MNVNEERNSLEEKGELYEQITRLCLSLPEASERTSHGAPTFFIRDKLSFVQYHNNHHGDGKVALWCAAPAGIQQVLIDTKPEQYFVPAYVGHLGWVGIRLDQQVPWREIEGTILDAYVSRAPKALKEQVLQEYAKPH